MLTAHVDAYRRRLLGAMEEERCVGWLVAYVHVRVVYSLDAKGECVEEERCVCVCCLHVRVMLIGRWGVGVHEWTSGEEERCGWLYVVTCGHA